MAEDPVAIFQRGLADHQAGRLAEAEGAYRRVLELSPEHPDTLHLYGLLAHQCGHNAPAAELIGRALARQPDRPDFLSNLGLVLNAQGQSAEAEAVLLRALAREPNYADALNNLGIALFAQGRPEEAKARYEAALRAQPRYPEALNNLGRTQAALGDFHGAEASYRAALAINPGMADAHGNLGLTLYAQERLADAEACYRQALGLRPAYWDALNNLGVLLSDAGRLEEAEGPLREAIRVAPDKAEAYANLGTVLTSLGRAAEAETVLRQALGLAPAAAEAHMNLGAALHGMGQGADAEAAYREALRHNPSLADAHANLAYALLLAGRLEEAWPEYEWRWQTKHMLGGRRGFSAPQWRGEPLDGRTLLVHAEQGLGDTLQFCRYAPLIEGGRVILEVQRPLARLAAGLPGVAQVIVQGDPLPPFDLHCPLLSLPLAFGTTLATIPAQIPYLTADADLAANWRERLASLPGLKVGLVWAGSRRTGFADLAAVDRRRSVSLSTLAPLAGVDEVSFISLQKDAPGGQAAEPPAGMALADFTTELGDFADTAALIDALDLVVCVDTSVAHMAGALGKPVWLLNRYDNCWRWLIGRSDSPWYPSLRQFRQPAPGDWASVMEEVRAALAALTAAPGLASA